MLILTYGVLSDMMSTLWQSLHTNNGITNIILMSLLIESNIRATVLLNLLDSLGKG